MQSKNSKTKPVQVLSDDLKDRMPFRLRSYLFAGVVLSATLCSIAFGDETAPKIERILCEGNARTRCDVLIAQTLLVSGEALDDAKVSESRDRLRLSGNFKEADIQLSKGSGPGLVDLTVVVEERSSLLALGSLVYLGGPTEKYTALDVTAADSNFTGHSDSLALRVRSSRSDFSFNGGNREILGSLEYIRPSLIGKRVFGVLGVGLGNARSFYDYTYETGRSQFDYNRSRTWTYGLLGYKLSDYSNFSVGYRRTFFLDHGGDTTRIFDGMSVSERLPGNFDTLTFQFARDSQDNANFPTEGSRIEMTYAQNYGAVDNMLTSAFYAAGLFHLRLSESDILSFKIGRFLGNDGNFDRLEDSGFSLRYSKYFLRHQDSLSIQNASAYVEPGLIGGYSFGRLGVKAGLAFQTKFGVINLSFAVTQ